MGFSTNLIKPSPSVWSHPSFSPSTLYLSLCKRLCSGQKPSSHSPRSDLNISPQHLLFSTICHIQQVSEPNLHSEAHEFSLCIPNTHTHTAYWGKTDSQFLNHSHTASQHSSWTQLALSQQLTPASSETFNIKLSSTWWRFDGCIHTVRDWQLFTNRCSSQTVLLLVQPTEAVFLYKRITKGKPLLYSDNRKSFMYL